MNNKFKRKCAANRVGFRNNLTESADKNCAINRLSLMLSVTVQSEHGCLINTLALGLKTTRRSIVSRCHNMCLCVIHQNQSAAVLMTLH